MSRSCHHPWGRFDQVPECFEEPLWVLEGLHLDSEGGEAGI